MVGEAKTASLLRTPDGSLPSLAADLANIKIENDVPFMTTPAL